LLEAVIPQQAKLVKPLRGELAYFFARNLQTDNSASTVAMAQFISL
jgi:fructose-1-phosphate kinase PfkB-like protein